MAGVSVNVVVTASAINPFCRHISHILKSSWVDFSLFLTVFACLTKRSHQTMSGIWNAHVFSIINFWFVMDVCGGMDRGARLLAELISRCDTSSMNRWRDFASHDSPFGRNSHQIEGGKNIPSTQLQCYIQWILTVRWLHARPLSRKILSWWYLWDVGDVDNGTRVNTIRVCVCVWQHRNMSVLCLIWCFSQRLVGCSHSTHLTHDAWWRARA